MRDGGNFEIYPSIFSSLLLTVLKTNTKGRKQSEPQVCNLIERYSGTGAFLWILLSFKNTVFVEHLRWLLLKGNKNKNVKVVAMIGAL